MTPSIVDRQTDLLSELGASLTISHLPNGGWQVVFNAPSIFGGYVQLGGQHLEPTLALLQEVRDGTRGAYEAAMRRMAELNAAIVGERAPATH